MKQFVEVTPQKLGFPWSDNINKMIREPRPPTQKNLNTPKKS